jgi:hypothetical protein
MKVTAKTRVHSLLSRYPVTAESLGRRGVVLGPGLHKLTLETVCEQLNLDLDELLEELGEALEFELFEEMGASDDDDDDDDLGFDDDDD